MNATILFIDDSADDVDIAQWRLNRAGMIAEALRAGSTDELQSILERRTVDLIVSDFRIPVSEGVAILELAKTLAPAVPFILYSGLLLPSHVILASSHGAYGCVSKDDHEAFVSLVKTALKSVATRTSPWHRRL